MIPDKDCKCSKNEVNEYSVREDIKEKIQHERELGENIYAEEEKLHKLWKLLKF